MNKTPSSVYKVRFNDCDMFGHLNNARYLDYMINARQDHLKDTYNFDYNGYYKNNQGWVVSFHEIQYLKPAFFEEMVCIQSALRAVDEDSLFIEIIMMNEEKTQLKAVLRSKLTFINLKTGRKEKHLAQFIEWAKSLVTHEQLSSLPVHERVSGILAHVKNK